MATQVQNRRGTTAEHSTFTGAVGEVTVDTDKEVVVVHDGTTAGGYPQMRENGSNSALALGSAGTPSLKFAGDPNTGIYSPGADQVAISTGGTGRVFINASGNLGVGVSNPAEKLQLADGNIYLGTGDRIVYNGGASGNLTFQTGTLGNLIFNTQAGSERLRITSAGLVGIGTSSPGSYDSFGDDLVIAGSNTPGITLVGSTTGYGSVLFADGTVGNERARGYVQYNHSNDSLIFGSAGSDRVVVDSSGRVGIGTTSPARTLDVNGTARIADGSAIEWGGTSAYIAGTSASNALQFFTSSSERARIDSSGRLLVGTSSVLSNIGSVKQEIAGGNFVISSFQATPYASSANFVKSRSTSGLGAILSNGDQLGPILWYGDDGTATAKSAASTEAFVDGTPGANDMPGRLVFSTTADGASSPTERLRITNDGVQCYNQPTPTSKSAAATLTVAELKTGIIQYTGAAATLTLPTGTLTEGGFSGIYTNMTFEWSVINTGSGTCTIGAGTDHTIVGGATVAAGESGRFASRRTAANTFVSYRLS